MADEKCLFCNNVGKVKWSTTNHANDRLSSEQYDVLYMLHLEVCYLLEVPFRETKGWFKQVLYSLR